jgi:predicted transcriptional regulator
MDTDDTQVSAKLAADVLIAYLRRNTIPAADLPALARALREALSGDALPREVWRDSLKPAVEATTTRAAAAPNPPAVNVVPDAPKSPTPAVAVTDSIHDEYLISLEDGKHYRSLRRHLMAKYGMTPDDYRLKWQLPADYPMVAPSYARDRSEVAKRSGLGRLSSTPRRAPKRA